ncbi:MAG: RtcB family protein [archaeon]
MVVEIKKIDRFHYEIPKEGNMRVPGMVIGNEEIISQLKSDSESNPQWNPVNQIKNMASLPGVVNYSFALADVHVGYGAVIGSVNAFDMKEGVITFAGVGYDINCGVHSLVAPVSAKQVEAKKKELAETLFKDIPAGIGSEGQLKLNSGEMDEVLEKGAAFAVARGFGTKNDLKFIEEEGCISGANSENVSAKAKERAYKQIGTLGSGNHYCEVQEVEKVFDEEAAKAYGLAKGGVAISIHCGSRALGHQIGGDYIPLLEAAAKKYNISLPDREMVCAPIASEEGQKYFSAVKAGCNAAFANRQVIGVLVKRAFAKVFGIDEDEVKTLYDVGHNTAKEETHNVGQKRTKLLVQRKGSTRGFGPGREEVPTKYRKVGQPVLVGGTMGTHSYILKGTNKAMEETFGSTIHGAGRLMSRTRALKERTGQEILADLAAKGIIVKSRSIKGIAEEAPGAYKDIEGVVGIMQGAGISERVARLKPIVCVKG